jgi:hypothetical protein
MRRIAVGVSGLITGLGSMLLCNHAFACATCLCGDPTITIMGTEKPFSGRLRGSIEYINRGETVGTPGVNEHVIDEERLTYSLSYNLTDSLIVAASLPLVSKTVTRYDLSREEASGLGDMDLNARWVIGGDEHFPARHLWGLSAGMRVPTSTEQESGGTPIDFDAQPGAGTTIANFGLWYGHYRTPWFFYTSFSYQHALDEGYQGYQAGDVLLVTGHSQYALHKDVALSFSLDARSKRPDHYYNEIDPNSGGVLIMASPGIAWTPVTDLIVNATLQVPVIENVHGRQEEDNSLRIGVTYDF